MCHPRVDAELRGSSGYADVRDEEVPTDRSAAGGAGAGIHPLRRARVTAAAAGDTRAAARVHSAPYLEAECRRHEPCSFLGRHPGLQVLADRGAASSL
jgi:hypothetical protein